MPRTLASMGGLLGAATLVTGFLQLGIATPAGALTTNDVTIVVNSSANTGGPGGCTGGTATCTLPEALYIYNGNSDATNTITDYTITFSPGLGTIDLASSLSIDPDSYPPDPLTITGNGEGSTVIDGGGSVADVILPGNNEPSPTISGLTLQNSGGNYAITDSSTGTLTLTDVSVSNNDDGGIFNGTATGTIKASNVTVDNNLEAGGIFNDGGTFSGTNLTVDNNTDNAFAAGGITNSGTLNLGTSSLDGGTIAGNAGDLNGGGILNDSPGIATLLGVTIGGTGTVDANTSPDNGGGIQNNAGATLIYGNSSTSGGTLAANTAGGAGGGLYNAGTATLTGVTVGGTSASDGNSAAGGNGGGGIYTVGPLTASGGSIQYNTASDGGGGGLVADVAPGTVTLTNETIDNNTATPANGGGGIYSVGDALVVSGGSISYNTTAGQGGGVLLVGSNSFQSSFQGVAIDNNSGSAGGGVYDTSPVVFGGHSDISHNRATVGAAGGLYTGASGGPVCAGGSYTLPAYAPPLPTSFACFDETTIDDNQSVPTDDTGGGVVSDGTALFTNGTISSNSVGSTSGNPAEGGGLYQNSGTLLMVNETVDSNSLPSSTGNEADPQDGAGLDLLGTADIYNSSISNNSIQESGLTEAEGGGIFTDGATATLGGDTISGNSGAYLGGGIANTNDSTLTLTASTVSGNPLANNSTDDGGAGIFNDSGSTVTALNDTITGNTGAYEGGGFYNEGTLMLTNLTISDNQATQFDGTGGGIYNAGGTVTLQGTILAGDTQGEPAVANECAGGVTSNNYNLDQGNSCGLTGLNDISAADPELQPLTNNGGLTETQALGSGSAAIGGELAASCPEYDQRGVIRPSHLSTSPCDIGAYQTSSTSFPPTVTGVSPNSGPSAGGIAVTISGTNFTPDTEFNFGSGFVEGTGCTATACTVIAPPGSGLVNVQATVGSLTSAVTSADEFTYPTPAVTAPEVLEVSPNSGPPAGSTSVTISGANFSTTPGDTLFTFGATTVAGTSCTTIECDVVTPAGTGTVNVLATVGAQTSAINAPEDQFTYVGSLTPTVTSVTSSSGPQGATVTITGTNFSTTPGGTAFFFGPNLSPSVTCSSTTHCEAVVPTGSGAVNVQAQVGTLASPTSSADTFTYTGTVPSVTGVSPNLGPGAGGTAVTITGTGFSTTPGATSITVGGIAATEVGCSSTTTCTALTPAGTGTVDVQVTVGSATSAVNRPGDEFTYQGTPTPPVGTGGTAYDLVGSDGGVFVFGQPGTGFYGSLPGIGIHVNNIVGIMPTADDRGYWLVGSDGGVFAFGDAPFVNSLPGIGVHVNDIVGIVPSNNDEGYYLVGRDGGVFAFNAPFENSLPGENIHVNNIVGIAATANDQGYWVVSSTGTVYNLGNAASFGNAPAGSIVSIAATPNDGGYWLAGSNGNVYPFGNAQPYGTIPGLGISVSNIVSLVPTNGGTGYLLIGSDGGIFAFNTAFPGSLPGIGVHVTNIVGATPA